MKRNGFTLIELLAVIVILAIIAVIAVPIVLNIIDETKSNATLRSADFYLDAVEMSVAQATLKEKNIQDGTYNILENGNICLETYDSTNKICVDSIDEGTDIDILEVEVNGEHPKEGTITITNGVIKSVDITLSEKRITKNDKGEIIYFPCTLISGEENTIGSKYECEVSPGVKYNFYVLSQEPDGTTNLIMDRNMCSDGTPTEEGKTCLVAWNIESGQGTNAYGPVTAMKYLHNATKSWINIPSLNYAYNDKEFQGTTTEDKSYTSFVSNNGVATITALDKTTTTTIGSKEEPLKARMPIHINNSTNSSKNEVTNSNGTNEYLYENLDSANNGEYWYREGTQPGNNISGIFGYWTLSSYAGNSNNAWRVSHRGYVDHYPGVDNDSSDGVRAVINLKL